MLRVSIPVLQASKEPTRSAAGVGGWTSRAANNVRKRQQTLSTTCTFKSSNLCKDIACEHGCPRMFSRPLRTTASFRPFWDLSLWGHLRGGPAATMLVRSFEYPLHTMQHVRPRGYPVHATAGGRGRKPKNIVASASNDRMHGPAC